MSLERLQSFSFLKSSRFLFQFLTLPKLVGAEEKDYIGYFYSATTGGIVDNSIQSKSISDLTRDMTFLCESIEFPGQSLTGVDYRIPGKLKIKTPTVREYNEITANFLYPEEFPIYELFNNWIWNASLKNSQNYYFDDIVGEARIIQFSEGGLGTNATGEVTIDNQVPYNKISLKNLYPTSISPLQSNWGDDGFHKLSVTFFFEGMDIYTYAQNALGRESEKIAARQQFQRNVSRATNNLSLERVLDITSSNDLV